ncbi:MAG: hypothetical protein H6696_16955 [Deferribacteres bacterium]|nr:hypothetical protein [candidate division KSB1 bacterium]MCB9503624.1 hypothetical protein [Deferribacteres bacterium]
MIVTSYLGLSYLPGFGWWISMIGTGLIILCATFAWPTDIKKRLGIPRKLSQYLLSFFLLIVFAVVAYFLMNFIRTQHQLGFAIGTIQNFSHIFFYTLNEELILGGLILLFLQEKYKHAKPLFISMGVAGIFSIMHYIFYRWIFQGQAQGILSFAVLISLLIIGVVKNNFILKTGHIGYAWALHFSWMALMFGCGFYRPENLEHLSQTARFNLFLGDGLTMLIGVVLALGTSVWLIRIRK